jgi:hypothetical protein
MKVYEKNAYININGEWEAVSMFPIGYVVATEQPTDDEYRFNTFPALWNNCHIIRNASSDYTFFKKKEMVRLSILYRDFPYRITAKNMKNPILYKVEFTEVKKPSYNFLVNNLSAPDFIKYVKYYEEKFQKPIDKQPKV